MTSDSVGRSDVPRVIDVFNGDADGLCALVQLRGVQPVDPRGATEAIRVTGLKREIELLATVSARAGDRITVLDISMERNRAGLLQALAAGAHVRYFDHHHAGEIPEHPGLQAFVDTSPDVCTSILVDRYLNGARRPWAVVAAFGDGLPASATALALGTDLSAQDITALRDLGQAINHNAYGESLADVLIAPDDLFDVMLRYPDPRQMLREELLVADLLERCRDDLARAQAVEPVHDSTCGAVYVLPDEGWSRRAVGSFANLVAARDPSRASVVAIVDRHGHYRISVRAGQSSSCGADELCRGFGGNGRAKAAGIDRLPPAVWPAFLERIGQW